MKKYLEVVRISWNNSFVYRLNFIMWRVRIILGLLTGYFLWLAVFSSQREIFGYTQSAMLTYVLVATMVQSLVFSSRSIDLASIINSGDLSTLLIKPLSNLIYWFSQDIADKALNILFAIGEITLLFILLRPPFQFPSVTSTLFLTFIALPLSTILYYFINYLFGLLGFWTPEVWAPRFVLFVLLMFVAGNLFPLDILPLWLQRIMWWTPFPYLVYYPTKIWLGQFSASAALCGAFASIAWIGILYYIVAKVWQRGLQAYGAEGR